MDYLGSEIAKLGFGLMRLPMLEEEVDVAKLQKMVDDFMAAGFTYFDTAYVYTGGKSEEVVSDVLSSKYPRDAYQLATKLPIWEAKKKEDMQVILNKQLERCGVEYFDYYLIHAIGEDRIKVLDEYDGWQFMIDQKIKGTAKHIGFSFHDTADVLDKILTDHPEMEFVQLQINYVDWESDDIQSRLCYEVAKKHNKPVIIMEPVKGGNLAIMPPDVQKIFKTADPDGSVASWALRYAGSFDNIITVLSGMSNDEQMHDNIDTFKDFEAIDESDKKVIAAVVEKLAEQPTIPCTDCKYCVDDCPMNIAIPGVFEVSNDYKIYGNLDSTKGSYGWATSKGGKASACIECGVCETLCPQHIKIIDELAQAAELFE